VPLRFFGREWGNLYNLEDIMKRYDATKCISDEILRDKLVEALFLKGSIARKEDDEYSDVDMYAAVSSENWNSFLK
jgi:predicted nucleotidyltransferase